MQYRPISLALAIVAGFACSGAPAAAECGYSAMPETGPTATMLVVEAQVEEVIAERMQSLRSDVRKTLIGGDIRRFTQLDAADDHVTVRITNPEDIARGAELLRDLSRPLGGILIGNGDQTFRISPTEPAITEITSLTMRQTLKTLGRRFDEAVMDALDGYAELRRVDEVGPNAASGRNSALNAILKWFD